MASLYKLKMSRARTGQVPDEGLRRLGHDCGSGLISAVGVGCAVGVVSALLGREAVFEHWQRCLLGLMADLKRESISPTALAAGVAVQTLQEFLAFFV